MDWGFIIMGRRLLGVMTDQTLRNLFDACYRFSARILNLPKGKPSLEIVDCPSETFPTIENTADSEYSLYRVRLNRAWASDCLNRNRQTEIEFQIFHELRHLHQNAAIRWYHDTGETGYDNKELIEAWAANYAPGAYIRNDNSGEANLRLYNAQPVERDANAYGWLLLQVYHCNDGADTSLPFPDEAEPDFFAYQSRPEIQSYLAEQQKNGGQAAKGIPFVRPVSKIGPNDPCPCGSGKKYKKCTCDQYH